MRAALAVPRFTHLHPGASDWTAWGLVLGRRTECGTVERPAGDEYAGIGVEWHSDYEPNMPSTPPVWISIFGFAIGVGSALWVQVPGHEPGFAHRLAVGWIYLGYDHDYYDEPA